MNLYQVMANHYAPKDCKNFIWGYVVAESNEQLYEWLKSEPRFDDGVDNLYLSWKDKERDDSEDEEYENFKFQMLTHNDEEATEYADYDDLYYGRTFVSWKLVKENAKPDILQLIADYGVRIFNAQ